jgi:hypothetical protein
MQELGLHSRGLAPTRHALRFGPDPPGSRGRSRHHTTEDSRAFPLLAELVPELRTVLLQLQRDHDVVSVMLRTLEELITGVAVATSVSAGAARRLRGELDGLVALLESPFRYEEEKLVGALNRLELDIGR